MTKQSSIKRQRFIRMTLTYLLLIGTAIVIIYPLL